MRQGGFYPGKQSEMTGTEDVRLGTRKETTQGI